MVHTGTQQLYEIKGTVSDVFKSHRVRPVKLEIPHCCQYKQVTKINFFLH